MTNPIVQNPVLSICIPTYNGRDHLKECFDSILAQTFHNFEVLVCDDESSDGTLEFARQLASGDQRFRFVPNPRRFGLVGNWNNCIGLARGEWIKFVFQDDLIAPTCVEKLLRACTSTGKVFGFCARDFIFEAGTSDAMKRSCLGHQASVDAKFLNRPAVAGDDAAWMNPGDLYENPVGEPTVTLIAKCVFEEIGLFDKTLIQLCDAEMWCRIISNFGAAWVPERLASFRIHAKAATGVNLTKRSYRMLTLDPLIMLYRYAFDPRFSSFRTKRLAGRRASGLRLDCASGAYYARRTAERAGRSADDKDLMSEWNAVTADCPHLNWLARTGQAVVGFRNAQRAARRVFKG